MLKKQVSRLSPKQLLAVVFVIVGAFYIYYQAQDLINGPQISVSTPENGATFEQPLIQIEGTAKNVSRITLNDRDILIDQQGTFREKMLLLPGYNIMEIEAEDRFGRETQQVLEYVYTTPIHE